MRAASSPGANGPTRSRRSSPRRARAGRAAAGARGEPDDGTRYYEHWLAALEILLAGKKLIPGQELERRVDEWDAAARATPHGKPIELPIRQGSPRGTIPPKFS